MGIWDDIKGLFGGAPAKPAANKTERAVWNAMRDAMKRGGSFSAVNIADAAGRAGLSGAERQNATAWVEELYRRGRLDAHGYTRSLVRRGDRVVWIYHSTADSPAADGPTHSPSGPVTSTTVPLTGSGSGAPKKKQKKQDAPPDPYDGGDLMRLSPAELRSRAMSVVPWKTAWIGRVDVIPPTSDERTALVDRGLVLRGFFTEEEIREIHRIGDAWLEHADGTRMAAARAHKSADAALRALREDAAKAKAEKKRLAAERKKARREAIERRKAEDIVFLGRGVSGRLHDRRANIEALREAGLPLLATPADVAKALALPIPRLRWLAFHAEASEQSHYVQFEVPKRSGGVRLLSAPKAELRKAQRWILDELLSRVPLEAPAHGFVPGRSTVTNAAEHVGKKVVVNLDLENFFPSVTFPRVRGLFASLGYSPAAATVLALLTTEAPRREVRYDGKPYRVAVGPRGLPQGACTSPALSNLVTRKLDRRLAGLAKKHGWTYTRYADDLTFSSDDTDGLGMMIARVRHVVTEEGFRINEKKGRVQRSGGRQEVTGIVVNEKLSVPRSELRRLRAILHNAKKTGLAGENRMGHPHFESYVTGMIAYVSMVDPQKGAKLRAEYDALS
ncbi:MAG: reverse transcriptase family protein [Sandaracinaceae bacterium]